MYGYLHKKIAGLTPLHLTQKTLKSMDYGQCFTCNICAKISSQTSDLHTRRKNILLVFDNPLAHKWPGPDIHTTGFIFRDHYSLCEPKMVSFKLLYSPFASC